MNKRLVPFMIIGLLMTAVGLACQSAGQSMDNSMLKPGDEIDGMILSTGAVDAPPLWAFCSSQEANHVTAASCRVPQMSKLAIGHAFLAPDTIISETEWSELTWKLSVDGRAVKLNEFGTYNYVMPTMAPSPSPVREVFMKFTAWDVVLTDLQPGAHTLQGLVQSDAEEYGWVVDLTIEASDRVGLSSVP
jgi:hypothetical protein